MKKSVVKNITKLDPWEGKFGKMYSFKIVMENGDIGDYNSKSPEQNKFEIGKEAEYTFEDGAYPKIKPFNNFVPQGNYPNANYTNNDDRQKYIIRQSMLKAAVDFHSGSSCTTAQVIGTAEEFEEWVLNKKKPVEVPF